MRQVARCLPHLSLVSTTSPHGRFVSARKAMFDAWSALIESGEFSAADLDDECTATANVIRTVLDLSRV